MASEDNHLEPRDDFDPRFYESLGTERPQCVSRFGGDSPDHPGEDHRCEYDANVFDGETVCATWSFDSLGKTVVKKSQPHECACGQAVWVSGQRSVLLDGTTIVS